MSIYEVARRAGVSKSTVSRVINNAETVAPDTVHIVRRAMAELNYTPSPRRPGPKPRGGLSAAGSASSAGLKHGVVAVINVGRAPETLEHPWFVRLQSGIRSALADLGVNLVLDTVQGEELPLCVQQRRVDGLILTGQSPREDIIARFTNHPCVWLSGGGSLPIAIDHVLADNRAIAFLAADYLLGEGCRAPAFVNPDPAGNSTRSRQIAFEQRLEDHGVACRSLLSSQGEPGPDDWKPTVFRERMRPLIAELLGSGERPDGLFVPYAQHLPVAVELLRERGLASGGPGPETDVVLISVEREEVFVSQVSPRPTVIDPNLELMAAWAVRRLMSRIRGERTPAVRVLVPPRVASPE